jgi:hypothetical protein
MGGEELGEGGDKAEESRLSGTAIIALFPDSALTLSEYEH